MLLLPARGKANHPCVEFCEEGICPMLYHARIADLLKFFQVVPLVAQLAIFKAVATVFFRFPFSGVFREWHEATLTALVLHTHFCLVIKLYE